jgi:hypothetical protein
MISSAKAPRRGAMPLTAFGMKWGTTSRRNCVWSGGSMEIIIRGASAPWPNPVALGIMMPPADENVAASRPTRFTSS